MSKTDKKYAGGILNLLNDPNRTLLDVLDAMPDNQCVIDNIVKGWAHINSPKYKKILCTISGGSDSDDMMLITALCDVRGIVDYVFFNTGLEYKATHEHLREMEQTYNRTIRTVPAVEYVASAVKKYGYPFLNKKPVSDNIKRLQKYGFKWEDDDFETLVRRYCINPDEDKLRELESKRLETGKTYIKPWTYKFGQWWKGCVSALMWWCNENEVTSQGFSKMNINWNYGLKEFLIANPPTIKISPDCCEWAKKKNVHKLVEKEGYDLTIYGVRKAEGGARALNTKGCFSDMDDGCDMYRPLWWYKKGDKADLERHCEVCHSKCYTLYGLARTGCACCTYGDFEFELAVADEYEPQLAKAARFIFGPVYEYTRAYYRFRDKLKLDQKSETLLHSAFKQMELSDFIGEY